jgi:chitinase
MTYDFHGGWESKTGHNAPSFIKSKYNCHTAIEAYLAAGISSDKILFGLPSYGRGWQGLLIEFLYEK